MEYRSVLAITVAFRSASRREGKSESVYRDCCRVPLMNVNLLAMAMNTNSSESIHKLEFCASDCFMVPTVGLVGMQGIKTKAPQNRRFLFC